MPGNRRRAHQRRGSDGGAAKPGQQSDAGEAERTTCPEVPQKKVLLERERLSCSICLDLLKDPVTVPCGHSYCMNCINRHWGAELEDCIFDEEWDQNEEVIYTCPQCRRGFRPRPDLGKSIVLADLVEELKKAGVPPAPADHCYAGAADVACDVCKKRKLKAIKFCLVCLASFCGEHLQPHYESPPLKKHKLVEPSNNLQERICSQHNVAMMMFCRTDQQRICYLCSVDQHKGHDVVSAAAERTQRQRELELSRQEIPLRVQDREKDVKVLQKQVEAASMSADRAVEESEKILIDVINLLEKRCSEMKHLIRFQQRCEVGRVQEVQEKLQQEIAKLKKKDTELKQLSNTPAHNHCLLNWPSLPGLDLSTYSSCIYVRPREYFEDVTAALSQLRVSLPDLLRTNFSASVPPVDVQSPTPQLSS